MSDIFTTVKQKVLKAGDREMWAVYQVGMAPSLEQITSKRLDIIEYYTFDEDGKRVRLVFDITEARSLLANLAEVLGDARPTDRYIAGLEDIAAGRIQHSYNGSCPDGLEGWTTRDPDCPACQVLLMPFNAEGVDEQ